MQTQNFPSFFRQKFNLFVCIFFLCSCAHRSSLSSKNTAVFSVRIEEGDTLGELGKLFSIPWQVIANLNALEPRRLKVGDIVNIPQTANAWKNSNALKRVVSRSDGPLPELGAKPLADPSRLFWPIPGARISSGYGWRGSRMHDGLDIKAPVGTKIRSTAEGVVVFSGWQRGYGRTVIVEHEGFRSLYAHSSRLLVTKGERVQRGQVLALVGVSGRSTGAHLHFELRSLSGKALNPSSSQLIERLIANNK